MKHESCNDLRDVITLIKRLSPNNDYSGLIYKGALLGDCLSMSFAGLPQKSIMAGNKRQMAWKAREQSGTQAIPWGLAGGLRGSGLAWQYVSGRFRKGTPPSQPVDMALSCGAVFAGIKIAEEQPKGGWDEMGLNGCIVLAQDFCTEKQLNPEELQKARQQGQE